MVFFGKYPPHVLCCIVTLIKKIGLLYLWYLQAKRDSGVDKDKNPDYKQVQKEKSSTSDFKDGSCFVM